MITVDVPREAWQLEGQEVSSSRAFSWDKIRYLCLHWTGRSGVLPSWYHPPIEAMRTTQRGYLARRPTGYSIGYSFGMSPDDALLMEGRGLDFRAASNGDDEYGDDLEPGNPGDWDNDEVVSLILFLDEHQDSTPAMDARIRQLVAELREVKPGLRVVGHDDLDATACPGPKVQAKIAGGTAYEPSPDPDPPEEDDMTTILIRPTHEPFKSVGAVFTPDGHPVTQDYIQAAKKAGPVVFVDQEPHQGWTEATLHKMGEQARRAYGDNPKR